MDPFEYTTLGLGSQFSESQTMSQGPGVTNATTLLTDDNCFTSLYLLELDSQVLSSVTPLSLLPSYGILEVGVPPPSIEDRRTTPATAHHQIQLDRGRGSSCRIQLQSTKEQQCVEVERASVFPESSVGKL